MTIISTLKNVLAIRPEVTVYGEACSLFKEKDVQTQANQGSSATASHQSTEASALGTSIDTRVINNTQSISKSQKTQDLGQLQAMNDWVENSRRGNPTDEATKTALKTWFTEVLNDPKRLHALGQLKAHECPKGDHMERLIQRFHFLEDVMAEKEAIEVLATKLRADPEASLTWKDLVLADTFDPAFANIAFEDLDELSGSNPALHELGVGLATIDQVLKTRTNQLLTKAGLKSGDLVQFNIQKRSEAWSAYGILKGAYGWIRQQIMGLVTQYDHSAILVKKDDGFYISHVPGAHTLEKICYTDLFIADFFSFDPAKLLTETGKAALQKKWGNEWETRLKDAYHNAGNLLHENENWRGTSNNAMRRLAAGILHFLPSGKKLSQQQGLEEAYRTLAATYDQKDVPRLMICSEFAANSLVLQIGLLDEHLRMELGLTESPLFNIPLKGDERGLAITPDDLTNILQSEDKACISATPIKLPGVIN